MAETLETGRACRRFCTFRYRTQESWSAERRVIAKAEALAGQGDGQPCKENSRTIVTSLDRPGQALYEDFSCARGDADNRVKEVGCDLFAARSSSNLLDANVVRLCLVGLRPWSLQPPAAQPRKGPRSVVPALPRSPWKLIRIGAVSAGLRTPHPHRHVQRLSRQGRLCRRMEDAGAGLIFLPATRLSASCSRKPGVWMRLPGTRHRRRQRTSAGPRTPRSHVTPCLRASMRQAHTAMTPPRAHHAAP